MRSEALARTKSGKLAIIPGDPDHSEMIRRISSKDPEERMPYHHPPLTDHEIQVLTKWIKQGAKYEKHWAFLSPKTPALPVVKNKDWVKNEIDYFVVNKQEQKGLSPNPEADKERLLKRISLDLNGLPPSLEMMDKFLADQSPNAYEKAVDELLAKPAYGEKMALHWLDVARYADSHGYQDDGYRTQWPWRDWLIASFARNQRLASSS